jgi:hypothetical protein
MLNIIYYWDITINYDKFDNVIIYVFTNEESYQQELKNMNILNEKFQNYSNNNSGDKFTIGNTIKFDIDNYEFTNAYFIVSYNVYHCILELYCLTNIPIDVADLLVELSKVKLTNLDQPYNGSFLKEYESFMNNDNWCLYYNTNIVQKKN